ncbi:type II toxin-antitoxin system YoeB family toxin [Candidatus Albibeggiatoa sp. nov. BB20]|uniref:type II toxin-antitoxin system YoeB family toxin n=1 Tax=Candidatus Albibeggiatoa sp. nov. BB20 TaxID=3162723 RepID=UPI0033657184
MLGFLRQPNLPSLEQSIDESFIGNHKIKTLKRIDDTHRLVYAVNNEKITIISCRYHY